MVSPCSRAHDGLVVVEDGPVGDDEASGQLVPQVSLFQAVCDVLEEV